MQVVMEYCLGSTSDILEGLFNAFIADIAIESVRFADIKVCNIPSTNTYLYRVFVQMLEKF